MDEYMRSSQILNLIPEKSAHLPNGASTVDPRRIFDGVPYRQPRHKEGTESALPSWSKAAKENTDTEERRERPKEKEKDSPKDKAKAKDKDKKTLPSATNNTSQV